ncbi:hypothetical protein [Desulfobacterium sp. N47]|uniref:hypothetical protein n=1 Tax=Desulfobacterium sp. N47 TaxID=3115210 RepID=UPI003F4A758D
MSSSPEQTLYGFTRNFFQTYGAETENNSNQIEVLLPEELAAQLNTPDHILVQTGADAQGEYGIAYGSLFLEKILNHVCDAIPVVECNLHFNYIKSQGFDRLIADRFSFNGASGTVETVASAMIQYIVLSCRYTAQSDEQKEGMVSLCFNLETSAPVAGMEDFLYSVEKRFEDKKNRKIIPEKDAINKLIRAVEKNAPVALAHEIKPFQTSMNRRFKRDVENLNEYYTGMKQEMENSLKRPGLSDQLISDRNEKIRLIPLELEKKKDDLFNKYSIKTRLALCGAMILNSPAVKVIYNVAIGRKTRKLVIIYNPTIKSVDPLVCEGCGAGTYNIGFCDALHALCPQCRFGCRVCGKKV